MIAENDLALHVFSNSENNLFTENNFIANLSPLRVIGRRTNTRWNELRRGNYWSDYDGYDLNEDGVGDVAHKVQNVFEYLEGNYPRLRLYFNSPATAERSFHVIKGSTESDGAPLMQAVKLRAPLEPNSRQPRAQWFLGFVSLVIFSLAAGVIWKGQRR